MRVLACLIAAALIALILATANHAQVAITQTVTLSQQMDVFQVTSQTFTLGKLPDANVDAMVFVNGLLMAEGIDYVLNGKTLAFSHQTIGPNPVIQVRYWTAQ